MFLSATTGAGLASATNYRVAFADVGVWPSKSRDDRSDNTPSHRLQFHSGKVLL